MLEVLDGTQTGATCFSSEQLASRIAHYGSRKADRAGLRVVLELTSQDAGRLRILRGGTVVSRRHFERLPAACADRRDAVALAIALALEHVATPAQPVAAAAEGGEVVPGALPPTATDSTAQPGPGVEPGTAQSAGGSAQPVLPASDVDSQRTAATSTEARPDAAASSPSPRAQTREPGERPADADPKAPLIMGNLPSATTRSQTGESSGETIRLHLGGRLVVEALPFAVWAGSVGAEFPLSRSVALYLSGIASLRGEAKLAGHRARGRLLGLEILGCRSALLGAFSLHGCAGAGFAAADVSGQDYPNARPDATLLWAAGLARIALRWPSAGPIGLRLLAQAQLNLSRPELRVEGATETLRAAWIGATAGLELVVGLR